MTRVANESGDRGKDLPTSSEQGPVRAPASGGPGMALRNVLDLDVLSGSRVLAGERGLDRAVTRVNVMEVPDVLPYVRRDELLVTTGYALRENPEQLAALVRELHRRGVTALGVKLGRYLDEIPASALDVGDELGFPLVALPASTSYDELLSSVLAAVLDHQAQRLTRSEDLHRALVQVVLGGGGLPEVSAALAAILDVQVLVTSADGKVVVRAPDPDGQGAEPGQADEELPAPALPSPPFDARGRLAGDALRRGRFVSGPRDAGYAIVPIVAGAADHGRIVALSPTGSFGDMDLQALERAATVCALAITKQQAVTAVESKYQADFLRDVLLGRAGGPDRTVPHGRALGWDLDRRLVVIVAEPDTTVEASGAGAAEADAAQRVQLERLGAAWSGAVRRRDPAAAVVGFTTEVVAVVAVGERTDAERLARELATSVAAESRVPFSVGVSRVVDGAARLPTAYEESRRALAVGRQVNGAGAVASFDRLGVHRLLSLVPDATELRSFERETLGELADDTAEAADLRHTLQVLLDTNLNVAQAARALHFHYNTLRYRIAKLERLLGPFTTDPLLRLDLALALRVVQMRGIPR
ncbi:MAG TPA: PucR family transcriptional regulator ligand-binding domain-containing protein [Actinomycetales bacterium]|nr:PucR family transcriptional regulator ligand-binding domain-containing protein [Actinomycetales bacterium]